MEREERLRQLLVPTVINLGIIVFGMISGVSLYLVVIVLTQGPPDFVNVANAPLGPLPMIAIGLALSGIVMANVLPKIIGAKAAEQISSDLKLDDAAPKYGQIYQLNTIIACALLEGPGFMGAVAFHIDGSTVGFCVAVLMALSLLTLLPTPARVVRWVNRRLEDSSFAHGSKESF